MTAKSLVQGNNRGLCQQHERVNYSLRVIAWVSFFRWTTDAETIRIFADSAVEADRLLRRVACRRRRSRGRAVGLGRVAARPRRADFYRPARSRRDYPARL